MALDLPCANRVYRFKCEDPHNEYVAVRSGLTKERGWSRVAKAKAAEGEAASRGGGSATQEAPDLIWTLDERSIDHDKLLEEQCTNHYRDISCLTTKAGLTRTMDELPWLASGSRAEALSFFPRSYTLDDEAHRAAFAGDFRRTAACAALRRYVDPKAAPLASKRFARLCLRACLAWAADLGGETDEVEADRLSPKPVSIAANDPNLHSAHASQPLAESVEPRAQQQAQRWTT